jgi:hypothetical protein
MHRCARHEPAKLANTFGLARTAQHKPIAVAATLVLMSYISRAGAHLFMVALYFLGSREQPHHAVAFGGLACGAVRLGSAFSTKSNKRYS